MTCDLKKLGCFFFSPWDETFCANDVSWYEHNADVGVCHEDAYNSPCPWPPSQEGSKHSEVTPWAVSCQARDPHYHRGVAWPWIEAEGYTTLLCFWWCHSHTRHRHTPGINQSSRNMLSVPPYNMMMALSTHIHKDTIGNSNRRMGAADQIQCSHISPHKLRMHGHKTTSLNRLLWKQSEVWVNCVTTYTNLRLPLFNRITTTTT